MWLYQAFGAPWIPDDVHSNLKTATFAEYNALFAAGVRGGALPRWNGSLYYPAKVPDLIGIKERRYIDHTATHLNRGVGDLMRYAALVSWAETTDFGPHRMLAETSERPGSRRSDEALYALALYLESLEAPPNPNALDEDAVTGGRVFQSAGCAGCHPPPLYTNNKLTLASGSRRRAAGMGRSGGLPPDGSDSVSDRALRPPEAASAVACACARPPA